MNKDTPAQARTVEFHPPEGISLREWFGDSYSHYCLVLQPFHPPARGDFSEDERKSAHAMSWNDAASRLGWSRAEVAAAFWQYISWLTGAEALSGPAETLRQTGWVFPPEDEIGSGVERILGTAMLKLGAKNLTISDELGTASVTVDASMLTRNESMFHQLQPRIGAVARVAGNGTLVVTGADVPHVLVCGRTTETCAAFRDAGAELVELSPDQSPYYWWEAERNGPSASV